MFTAGTRIGAYEVISALREGGMAQLALARRVGAEGFSRLVALKRVHEELEGEPELRARLIDEARLTASVAHPAVVRVEDLIEHDDGLVLVMEYVHGVTLGRLLDRLRARGLRLAPEAAVAIAARVAEGLGAAHAARSADGRALGLVHRDVSPQNVLIEASGRVLLIDFGIASASVRRHESTTGHVLGKLRYAAPEQLRRELLDGRADLYALGVLTWEMLTCEPLFDGTGDAIDGLRPRPRAPSTVAGGIGAPLDRAVLEALAPERGDRPASAEAMRDALLRACEGAWRVGAPELASLLEAIVGEELGRAEAELPDEARSRHGVRIEQRGTTHPLTRPLGAEPAPVTRAVASSKRTRPVAIALGIALCLLLGVALGLLVR